MNQARELGKKMTSQHGDSQFEPNTLSQKADRPASDGLSIHYRAEQHGWMFLGGALGVGAALGSRSQALGSRSQLIASANHADHQIPRQFDAIASTLKRALLRLATRKALEKASSYLKRATDTSQQRQWRNGTMKNNDIAKDSNSIANEGPYNPVPTVEKMTNAASTAVGRTLHRGAEGLEAGARYVDDLGTRHLRSEVTRMMTDHPVASLALGVGLGFLIGRLVLR